MHSLEEEEEGERGKVEEEEEEEEDEKEEEGGGGGRGFRSANQALLSLFGGQPGDQTIRSESKHNQLISTRKLELKGWELGHQGHEIILKGIN